MVHVVFDQRLLVSSQKMLQVNFVYLSMTKFSNSIDTLISTL